MKTKAVLNPEEPIEVGPGLWFAPLGPTLDVRLPEIPNVLLVVTPTYDAATGRLDIESLRVEREDGAPPMRDVLADLAAKLTIESMLRGVIDTSIWVGVPPEALTLAGTEPLPNEDESVYVARLYRVGFICGHRPTQFVQQQLGCAESTAAQKVGLARKLGHLPKTTPGKAGI